MRIVLDAEATSSRGVTPRDIATFFATLATMTDVKIRQYVYFALFSPTMTAVEIASHIGLDADAVLVKGSRHDHPRPVPRQHSWEIECRTAGLRVDEQIEQVLARIAPVAEQVRVLAETADVATRLQIVRFFADENGEEELFEAAIDADGGRYERLPGQHQLLGWGLSLEQLTLLVSMRASIDSDEYN